MGLLLVFLSLFCNNPCLVCFQNLVLPVHSTLLVFLLVLQVLADLVVADLVVALAGLLVLADLVVVEVLAALVVAEVLADLVLLLLVLDSA